MDDRAKTLMNQGLPWRREARWYVVGLEALVLIVIGAYILIATDTARDNILQLIGLVLLVTSVLLGAASLRRAEAGLGFFDAFRAGIGVTVGVIATASWWSSYIDTHAIRIILGWGLIVYCVIHLIGLVAVRGRSGLRPSVLVTILLTLVLGIILLTGSDTNSNDRLRLFGIILLVFGILLAGLAYYIFSSAAKRGASVAPAG